jgi:heme a synthase
MSEPSTDRWTLSARRFRQIAIVTTAGLCLLVVAGGVVRLTGSGLGCDDWPNCNDESFVDVSSGHTAIEQVNRLLSGVIGIPTLAMAIGSFRVRPRRAGLVGASIAVLVTVLANGVVGGIAVRQDLHPALVQSHFLLAMASIAFGLVAIRRSALIDPIDRDADRDIDRDTDRVVDSMPRRAPLLGAGITAATALAIVTGTVVTGTGPHAGDEDVRRWGFDISTVARIHSTAVWMAVALALVLALQLRRRRGRAATAANRTMSAWMFVAIVQGGIGYLQYFTGVPEVLVAAHITGATALWVLTVWLAIDVGGAVRITTADVSKREHMASISAGVH